MRSMVNVLIKEWSPSEVNILFYFNQWSKPIDLSRSHPATFPLRSEKTERTRNSRSKYSNELVPQKKKTTYLMLNKINLNGFYSMDYYHENNQSVIIRS